MKVRFRDHIINLRAENEEEKLVLDEMWDHGVVAFGGGSELGICSKKHYGSGSLQECSENQTPAPKVKKDG